MVTNVLAELEKYTRIRGWELSKDWTAATWAEATVTPAMVSETVTAAASDAARAYHHLILLLLPEPETERGCSPSGVFWFPQNAFH